MLFIPFRRDSACPTAPASRSVSFFLWMIPAWSTIGVITIALVFLSGVGLGRDEIRWFRELRRPVWLTFEQFIPLIWTTIFICGAASATIAWNASPDRLTAWGLMGYYLALELMTLAYTSIMCQTRCLRVGTIIGGSGLVLAVMLCLTLWPLSPIAVALLVPYLLWSPIGTYTTWVLGQLNPSEW